MLTFLCRFAFSRLVGCAIAAGLIVAAAAPAQAVVTGASLSANPASYNGPCPVTINFSGTISGTSGSLFQWAFERNGVMAPLQPGSISNSGALAVSDSIVVNATSNGNERIYALDPRFGAIYSAPAPYSVTCTSTGPTPAPTTSPAQLRIISPPLAPCPTCTVQRYTLPATAADTWGHEDGGGANIFCGLPHYLHPGYLTRPPSSTIVGFTDTYVTNGCSLGASLTDFWKVATLLRFDFSGHAITHIYSARLKADVAGGLINPAGPAWKCVQSVRLLSVAWPSSRAAGLLSGGPTPQGPVVTTQSSSVFVSTSALDADVSKAFRPLPFAPPGSAGPLLVPTNLWVDDPHSNANPHTNDTCLVYFTNWRLEIAADH